MNITVISTPFIEKGTAIFNVSFFDENSAAVAPNSIYYSLTDVAGSIVNSLQDVGLSNPAASAYIILSSNDLQISSGYQLDSEARRLMINANYNSSLGNNLSLRHMIKFDVTNPGIVL